MTETLSGLGLRIAVAKKLGFLPEVNESFNIEIGNDGRTWEPGTRWSITNGSCAYLGSDGTVESAWRTVPAFESDLGALQAAGVASKVLNFSLYYGYGLDCGVATAEELAANICKLYLKFDNEVFERPEFYKDLA